jgi:hypothetical protein
MDYKEIQFGNIEPEFDLSVDIIGTPSQLHTNENVTDTGLPDNFWFQNSSGGSHIRNNDLPGRADDKFSETVNFNDNQKVINKTYLMIMREANPLEDLERTLKLSFCHDDFKSNPLLKNILFLLPMYGSLFWACWPFKSEEGKFTIFRLLYSP